jgi:hypothetical protein
MARLFLPLLALVPLLPLAAADAPAAADTRVYELRIYHPNPGKMEALHARFRDHTLRLFEKHGMTNVGYWVPIDAKDRRLIYVLAYPSRAAREKSWKAFQADPNWKKARDASEVGGRLVARYESAFLRATDYSPAITPVKKGPRVFELRHYTASKGNLDALNARFREHTLKLFEKHGMTNVGYWVPLPGEKGADNTLIYLLAHKDRAAAKASFAAFRADPAWQNALKASEKKAGGPLTVKGGVRSTFLRATDYSPMQ